MSSIEFENFLNSTSNLSRFEHLPNEKLFDFEMHDLVYEHDHIAKVDDPTSIQFFQKLFLDNEHINKFCANLYAILPNISLDYDNSSLVLKVDFCTKDDCQTNEQVGFYVKMADRNEILYGVFLCELNKKIVQPIADKSDSAFNRFFSLDLDHSYESIHSSDNTFLATFHAASLKYQVQNNRYTLLKLDDSSRLDNDLNKHWSFFNFKHDLVDLIKDKEYPLSKLKLQIGYLNVYKNGILQA